MSIAAPIITAWTIVTDTGPMNGIHAMSLSVWTMVGVTYVLLKAINAQAVE